MNKGEVLRHPAIKRAMVRANPHDLYVFGDNMQRWGNGGQAREMRDEPNAVGIPTKWAPFKTANAFFRPRDWPRNATVARAISEALKRIEDHLMLGGRVTLPEAGVGNGKADLEAHCPQLYDFLRFKFAELERRYPPQPYAMQQLRKRTMAG